MIYVDIVVEDELSEYILKKIIIQTRPDMKVQHIWPDNTRKHSSGGFGYIESKISAFNKMAKFKPVIVLTDLDQRECAPSLVEHWLPKKKQHPNLLFRVAVHEIESWLLADREAFANFLGISKDIIPLQTDEEINAKEFLCKITERSRKRKLKQAILPTNNTASIGRGYNSTLGGFVQNEWSLDRAIHHSPSLNKAHLAIKSLDYTPE